MPLKSIDGYVKKFNGLHIETPLGLINIWYGTNDKGQRTETIQISPNEYAGENHVKVSRNIRNLQLVEETTQQRDKRNKKERSIKN